MRSQIIHDVSEIKFGEVEHRTLPDGSDYYTRHMFISHTDSYGNIQTEQFSLFSNDGYALVSKDDEAQQLLKAA